MIYRFRSKATGDVVMLGPNGDELLRLLGREPAAQGIIEPETMPQAIATLKQAVAASEAPADDGDEESPGRPRGISLRQRVWPVVQMLERAHAAGQPVVWGV
jgi:Domain of unknown function (DUF1840)